MKKKLRRKELEGLGFRRVTEWVIKEGKIVPPNFDWEDHAFTLYAFMVRGYVKYIGLSSHVLRSRMRNYTDAKTDQGARVRNLVLEELNKGNRVWIYGRIEQGADILKIEERKLITVYALPWNVR